MALYDKQKDWYDFLVPFSSVPSYGIFGSPLSALGEQAFGNGYSERLFDPTSVEMNYNTAERLSSQSFNQSEVEKQRIFDAKEAQKNRDFQERMSNTAYTRALNDLKGTGLNPYAFLSSGASSPVGATATSGTAYSSGSHISGGATSARMVQLLSVVANTALGLARIPTGNNFKVGF